MKKPLFFILILILLISSCIRKTHPFNFTYIARANDVVKYKSFSQRVLGTEDGNILSTEDGNYIGIENDSNFTAEPYLDSLKDSLKISTFGFTTKGNKRSAIIKTTGGVINIDISKYRLYYLDTINNFSFVKKTQDSLLKDSKRLYKILAHNDTVIVNLIYSIQKNHKKINIIADKKDYLLNIFVAILSAELTLVTTNQVSAPLVVLPFAIIIPLYLYALQKDAVKQELEAFKNDLEEIHKDNNSLLFEYYSMDLKDTPSLIKWNKKILISNTEIIRKISENQKSFREKRIK